MSPKRHSLSYCAKHIFHYVTYVVFRTSLAASTDGSGSFLVAQSGKFGVGSVTLRLDPKPWLASRNCSVHQFHSIE